MTQRILITGAAGGVGTLMRPRLAADDRILRLLDIADLPAPADGEQTEIIKASITDMDAMEKACAGVDAVIHLGGHSLEQVWSKILDVNINGTYVVLEAARRQGVKRVVLASSNHAVGYVKKEDGEAGDYEFPRPDTNYGVSKVAVEALGSLYADRYGLDVICVRIGSCFEKPKDVRMLSTWLSPLTAPGCSKRALPRRSPVSGSSGASRTTPAAGSPSTKAASSATSRRTTPRPTPRRSSRSTASSTRTRTRRATWAAHGAARTSTQL